MKPKSTLRAFLLASASLFAASPGHAGQTWDGGGGDDNWNTAANWDADTVPNFANTINFSGNTRNSPVNDLAADTTTGGINFTNAGTTGFTNVFTLTGNRITLGGDIATATNGATTMTDAINLDIILSGNRTITTTQTLLPTPSTIQHNLTLGGVISQDASSRSLTKAGAGAVTLNGAATNTFDGGLVINGGTLTLNYANIADSTSLVADTNTLTLNGGTLALTGKTGASTTTQSLGNVTVNAGGGSLLVNPNAGTSTTLALGTIDVMAQGSSLTIGRALSAGTGTLTITSPSNKDAQDIYGGRMVFSDGTGYQWATTASVSSPYTLDPYSAYTAMATSGTDTANSRITASSALTGALTTNSLKIANPAASQSLALGANTLTLASGGLLVTGTNSFQITGDAGATRMTAGNGSGSYELIVHQFNTGGLDISAVIGDNGANPTSLTKAGTGTLTLSGANTYSGDTSLNAGVVNLTNASGFGTSDVKVTGTARINATKDLTYTNAIDVSGELTLQAPGTLNVVGTTVFSGVLSGSGTITIVHSGSGNTQNNIDFTNAENTFTGSVIGPAGNALGADYFRFNSIGDGGTFTFNKSGNRGGVTYTGTSAIEFDTRQIAIGTAFGGGTNGDGLNGNGIPQNSFQNNASDPSHTVTFNADMVMTTIASNSTFYFDGSNGGNNTFAGDIGDPNGTQVLNIGKWGSGKWILTGSNSFEGSVIIGNGTLSVNSMAVSATNQPLGKGSLLRLGDRFSSGIMEYTGSSTTNSNVDRQFQIGTTVTNGGHTGAGSILNNGSGSLTFTSAPFNLAITNNAGASRTLTLGGTYDGGNGSNEIQGAIQNNTGAVAVTVSGSVWKLSGPNTYTGATILNSGGTLVLSGSNNSAGVTTIGAGGGTLRLDSNTNGGLASGNLNLNDDAAVVQAINADRTITNSGIMNANPTFSGSFSISMGNLRVNNGDRTLTNNITTGKSLTVASIDRDGTNNRNLTVNGTGDTIVSGAVTLGTGAVTKNDDGTLILNGTNAYTGGTTVTAGTLTVNGSLSDATMNISSGATVNCNATGTLTFNIDGTTADQVVNNGTIDLDGLTVAVIETGAGLDQTEYVLVDATGGGSISGTFAGVTGASGYTLDYDTPNQVKLVQTAGSPYDSWADTFLPDDVSNKAGDNDNDGNNNLSEFAFDGDPLSGANDGKIVSKIATVGVDQVLTLTLPVRNGAAFADDGGDQLSDLTDGIYYRIEGGTDLATFADTISEVTGGDATTIQTGLPTLSSGWTYRTFRTSGTVSSATKKFIRAKISETP